MHAEASRLTMTLPQSAISMKGRLLWFPDPGARAEISRAANFFLVADLLVKWSIMRRDDVKMNGMID
jgi:hypothetical protein